MIKRKRKPAKLNTVNIDPYVDNGVENYGNFRMRQLFEKPLENNTYLPKDLSMEDIDASFVDFVKNKDLQLVIGGEKITTEFLKTQKLAEKQSNWFKTDEDGNISLPYITIKRFLKTVGTRMGDNRANIPVKNLFKFIDIPVLEDGQVINYRFKISQPTNIDITYEINFYTTKRVHLNAFDELYFKTFNSRVKYMQVNEHYMRMYLERIDEVQKVFQVGGQNYFNTKAIIIVKGFTIDTDDYELVRTTRRPRIQINTPS